ncbi:ATP-binding protein [Chitinimonas sp.]|uniref:ATP-binding protein n=1 Tax=Chitinimonas sp. TaxID=1934313 RepID=UPI0035B1D0F5
MTLFRHLGARSIRTRLLVGAAIVLAAFLAGAGFALERAFADYAREARFARLKSTVFLLMAAAELDGDGALIMPRNPLDARLSLPKSGLYANISNVSKKEEWESGSTLGLQLPFRRKVSNVGEFQIGEPIMGHEQFFSVAYGVNWVAGSRPQPLVFSVLESNTEFRIELTRFRNTLWLWLGGAAVLLLIAQTWLLGWGLRPLRRVAKEISGIEEGRQHRIAGEYPIELAGLTNNLNTLIEQERARQTRYKDALGDLAHSLKTPLAVLRSAMADQAGLAAVVNEQVSRMDRIVQHQLGRAAASGASRFAPALPLRPVFERISGGLAKVYAERQLSIELDCAADLAWRLDEGDAFEMFGNLLDNACKWASRQVRVVAGIQGKTLTVRIEDDGPGFSDPEAALQRGVRLDERVPGHGIGLAVVADIVSAHGGHIEIAQRTSGGASISLTLPAG